MDFWKNAGKKAKKAVVIAAGTTLEAGSKLKKGAGDLYDKAAEDVNMYKEIAKINDYCAEISNNLKKDKETFESDFNKEKAQFTYILDKINRRLPTYNAIVNYIDKEQQNSACVSPYSGNAIFFSLGRDIDTQTGKALKTAGAAGLATGLGTVGLMTAFGTASTGTALSALTGSAYIHATLAALGGGSLAAGGFGMVGGAIALGTAFFAPAAVVGGYLFNKQVRKAYEEAVSRKAKAIEVKREQQILFQKLHKSIWSFRKLNYEFYAFAGFFDELLNMSIPAFAIGINNDYQKLIKKSVVIVNAFVSVPIITKNKMVNYHLEHDIQKIVMQFNECKIWLNSLFKSLGMKEAEAMNAARFHEVDVKTTDEIVTLVKELRKENGWKENKIKSQEATINEQEIIIREQNNTIQNSNEEIIRLTKDLKEVQANLYASKEKNEQTERIIEELKLQASEHNPEKYKEYEERLTKKFAHLNSEALQFVASGEMLYELFEKEEFEGVDFSSVIIEYGNCIENLLKNTLILKGIPITMRTDSKFAPIGQIINDCVRSKKYRHNFEEGFYELLDEFNRKCRVSAAHGRGVNKETLEKARCILFTGNAQFPKGLLLYFNDLLSE